MREDKIGSVEKQASLDDAVGILEALQETSSSIYYGAGVRLPSLYSRQSLPHSVRLNLLIFD